MSETDIQTLKDSTGGPIKIYKQGMRRNAWPWQRERQRELLSSTEQNKSDLVGFKNVLFYDMKNHGLGVHLEESLCEILKIKHKDSLSIVLVLSYGLRNEIKR